MLSIRIVSYLHFLNFNIKWPLYLTSSVQAVLTTRYTYLWKNSFQIKTVTGLIEFSAQVIQLNLTMPFAEVRSRLRCWPCGCLLSAVFSSFITCRCLERVSLIPWTVTPSSSGLTCILRFFKMPALPTPSAGFISTASGQARFDQSGFLVSD